MARKHRVSILLMLASIGISIAWGLALRLGASGQTIDFQGLYYGTKCLMRYCDPYDARALEHVYDAGKGAGPSVSIKDRTIVTLFVNLPTSFLLIAPLAVLPWGPAQALWLALMAGSLFLAAYFMWEFGADSSPGVSLLLICLVLANCEVLFGTANAAGIVISFCIIAVWCFLHDQFALAGVLCLAISLVIKPHDTGFVWLYFLLAGGIHRKRSLQTLAVTAVLGSAAIIWVSHVAPNWLQEMRSNLASIATQGGLNAPGVASLTGRTAGMVISLQAAFSVIRDDAHFYNPMSYLVSGALLLAWAIKTLRTRFTQEGAWLALAAVSALSLLPVYHRPYDAKLLLLAVPACAMLWAAGGMRRWIALGVTSAGIISTSDIPLAILVTVTKNLHFSTTTLTGKLMTILLLRPTPLILLAMGCFYLWVYVRYDPDRVSTLEHDNATERPPAPATT
ncbi:MAG: DUF2029 domain-containing protein [Acidobacteriota bacterium]|nr:DUF2029 domain-containing protein [Acidobacteriota bacterium]